MLSTALLVCLISALSWHVSWNAAAGLAGVGRQRRQTQCAENQFSCTTNSQCIDETDVCDGRPDCSDKSDESFTVCSKYIYECPAFAFKCSYGACVDGDAKCNGVQECADASDELLKECEGNVTEKTHNCPDLKFPCLISDQCIDRDKLCDGPADCSDGSDETVRECSLLECPPFAFRCSYGGCIDGDWACDGKFDCADGSDEAAPFCEVILTLPVRATAPTTNDSSEPTTPSTSIHWPTSNTCKLPPLPENGTYTTSACLIDPTSPSCSGPPGTRVPSRLRLRFTCHNGYDLGERNYAICSLGDWYPSIPRCSDTCEPLVPKSLQQMYCLFKGRVPVPCDKPVPTNTTAHFQCLPNSVQVKNPTYSKIHCRNGIWDNPLVDGLCNPACGKPLSGLARPFISHGIKTEVGEFPWHAGIYEWTESAKDYEPTCGGSLISSKVVISAAHCFYYPKNRTVIAKDFSSLKVGLGKYHRLLNNIDDKIFEQVYSIQKIEVPTEYRGEFDQYRGDIAVVVLKTEVQFTFAVMPVCVDLERWSTRRLNLGAVGKVVGWGLINRRKTGDTLLLAQMPYVPLEVCRESISSDLFHFATNDKICAGNSTTKMNVCNGDSGGGLVFEDPNSRTYFLHGIVSLGLEGCTGEDYSLFTSVSFHRDLVAKYLD